MAKITIADLNYNHIGAIITVTTIAADREDDNQVSVTGELLYLLHDPKGDGNNPATDFLNIGGASFSFTHDTEVLVY